MGKKNENSEGRGMNGVQTIFQAMKLLCTILRWYIHVIIKRFKNGTCSKKKKKRKQDFFFNLKLKRKALKK